MLRFYNEGLKSSSTGYTCTLGKALHRVRDIPCPFASNELIVGPRIDSRDKYDALPCQQEPYLYVIFGMLI